MSADKEALFQRAVECELIDRRRWQTHDQARMDVFRFIEGWYNTRRRHSAIDDLSPIDFEARARQGRS